MNRLFLLSVSIGIYKEFKLVDGTDVAGEAHIGFIPTVENIRIATFKDAGLVMAMILSSGLDSATYYNASGGALTVACAVEKGVLLADNVTTTQNRAVTIGIHASSYPFITKEAWDMIRAGIEWILK
jgi:hypothetical protein